MADGNRLLVAIDGSAHSLRALAHVIKRVASHRRLQICVLNVQPPLPQSLLVTQSTIAEYHKAKSKEDLARALRMLHRNALRAEIMVRVGEPGGTIAKVARRKHCGEIVLGSRGLGPSQGSHPGFADLQGHSRGACPGNRSTVARRNPDDSSRP
jgi:nucleotide-binding universal stress UspA family protein